MPPLKPTQPLSPSTETEHRGRGDGGPLQEHLQVLPGPRAGAHPGRDREDDVVLKAREGGAGSNPHRHSPEDLLGYSGRGLKPLFFFSYSFLS